MPQLVRACGSQRASSDVEAGAAGHQEAGGGEVELQL